MREIFKFVLPMLLLCFLGACTVKVDFVTKEERKHAKFNEETYRNMSEQFNYKMVVRLDVVDPERMINMESHYNFDLTSENEGIYYVETHLSVDEQRLLSRIYGTADGETATYYNYDQPRGAWITNNHRIEPREEEKVLSTRDFFNIINNKSIVYLQEESNKITAVYEFHSNLDVLANLFIENEELMSELQLKEEQFQQPMTLNYTVSIKKYSKLVEKMEVDLKPMFDAFDPSNTIAEAKMTIEYRDYHVVDVKLPDHLKQDPRMNYPNLELLGDREVFIDLGNPYQEPGVVINDYFDNKKGIDLTENLIIEGEVDTSRPGVYELHYYAYDSDGYKSNVAKRIVNVLKINRATPELTELGALPVDDFILHPEESIIYILDQTNKKVVLFDLDAGTRLIQPFELEPVQMVYGKGELYVLLRDTESGRLEVLDAKSLTTLDHYRVMKDSFDLVVDKEGYIYISSGSQPRSYITSYNRQGEQIDQKQMSKSSPLEIDGIKNRLYTIHETSYQVYKGRFITSYFRPEISHYRFNEDFKISPDGLMIVNTSGVVLNSERQQALEMSFKTELKKEYSDFAFNPLDGKLYGARIDPGNIIEVLDLKTLELVENYRTHHQIAKLEYQEGKLIAITEDEVMGKTTLESIEIHQKNQPMDSTRLKSISLDQKSFVHEDDILGLTIPERGKYLIDLTNIPSILLMDERGEVLDRLAEGDMINKTVELEKGTTYLRGLGLDEYGGALKVKKIETDDFADSFRETLPLGTFDQSNRIGGQINYGEDLDLFEVVTPYYLELTFHAGEHIRLGKIVNGDLKAVFRDGDSLKELKDDKKDDIYFVVYSETGGTGDYTFEVNYYSSTNDIPDYTTENIESIRLNEDKMGFFHSREDVDLFQIDILSFGYYYFHRKQSEITLFDELGNLVPLEEGYGALEAKTYYIQVKYKGTDTKDSELYRIEVLELPKDVDEVKPIELTGKDTIIGTIDYPLDQDVYTFTLTEPKYMTIELISENIWYLVDRVKLSLKDSYGNSINSIPVFTNGNSVTSLFPIGIYTIEADGLHYSHESEDKTYQINLTTHTQVADDYVDTHLFDKQHLGKLVMDEVTKIRFDTGNDIDVYYFDILEKGVYRFQSPLFKEHMYLIHPDGKKENVQSNIYTLSEGRYYLYFRGSNTVIDVELTHLFDDATIEDPVEITEGKHKLAFDYTSDQEYLKLTVQEKKFLTIKIPSYLSVEIYTEGEHLLYPILNYHNDLLESDVEFLPGTYIFKVIPNLHHEKFQLDYSIDLNDSDLRADEDLNNISFPYELYRVLRPLEQLEGRINSSRDVDVFILDIHERVSYKIQSTPGLEMRIYYPNTHYGFERINTGQIYTYDDSICYLIVRSIDQQSSAFDYTITLD